MPPFSVERLVSFPQSEYGRNSDRAHRDPPRQIVWPEPKNEEEAKAFAEDKRRVADNLEYFGAAACEYPYLQGVEDGYLAPCEVEAYTVHHDGQYETLDLSQFYIVFTSNLGGADILNLQHSSFATMERHILARAQQSLRPELFARITEKLVFDRPSYDVQLDIAKLYIGRELAFSAAKDSTSLPVSPSSHSSSNAAFIRASALARFAMRSKSICAARLPKRLSPQ